MSEMALDYRHRPISVRDYHLIADAGVFGPDESVELINGELVDGTTKILRRGDVAACTAFPNDPVPVDQIIL